MPTVLLSLIFIRPFISSLAFPYANYVYSGLLLAILVASIIYKRIRLFRLQQVQYPLMLFILAILISCLFSQDRINSIKEVYKYACGILLLITAWSLSATEKDRAISCLVTSGLIISIMALYQYCFGFHHLQSFINKQGGTDSFVRDYISSGRPFIPFVTPNILAGYLAMITPLALTQKGKRWFIVPVAMALLLTKSVGAITSLFLGLGLYFYLQERPKKYLLLWLSGFLLVLGLVLWLRLTTQKLHAQPLFSAMMRLQYWRQTVAIISAHPLTGVGLGNFNLTFSRYSHNSYLQIWAEMGILGLVSFTWLAVSILRCNLKTLQKSITPKTQIIGLICAQIIFLTHNVFDFSFFLPEISLTWWVIAGLSL